MHDKILLVDDEKNILEGYRRILGREFRLETAMGGTEALQLAKETGPFAVVISDMRMPGMDGIQVLSKIKELWPDTVRVMLTGNADIQTAIDAINEGSIFRFLNKPCSKEVMAKTITSALVQYRLVTAEKQLLEGTLHGCIQVMTEALSLVNPAAFGRAERARRYIRHVITETRLGNPWQYEIAAMMSQLGCFTLPAATIDAVYAGGELSPSDRAQYDAHPQLAYDLLSRIPRLEAVAWMVRYQNEPAPENVPGGSQTPEIRRGAEILRMILAYEKLTQGGMSRTEAAHTLSRKPHDLSPEFFEALVTLDPNAEEGEILKRGIDDLKSGMIIQQDVRTLDGTLVVSRGQEVTSALVVRLKSLYGGKVLQGDLRVSTPASPRSFTTSAG